MTALAPTPETHHEFLQAQAILHTIGFDAKAPEHWSVLGKAIGAVCRIKGCDLHTDALGMCPGHYRRHARAVRNESARINHDARAAA